MRDTIDKISAYLWDTRLDLSKRGCVGGASRHKGFIIGKVVTELLDDSLREFSLEEIRVRLSVRSLHRLHIGLHNIVDVALQEKVRYSELPKDAKVEVSAHDHNRFVVLPCSSMVDNYAVAAWEPVKNGLIRIHSLRHYRELVIEE